MKAKQKPVAAMESIAKSQPLGALIASLRLANAAATVQVKPDGLRIYLTIPWQFPLKDGEEIPLEE